MDDWLYNLIFAAIFIIAMVFVYKRYVMPWLDNKAFKLLEEYKWLKITVAIILSYLMVGLSVFIIIFLIARKILKISARDD